MHFFSELSMIADAGIVSKHRFRHQPFSASDGCPIPTKGSLSKEDVDDGENFI